MSSRYRTNPSSQPPALTLRLSFVRFFVVLIFTILGGRLVYVQGVLRTDLEQKASRQMPRAVQQETRRPILDRNGLVLAETVPIYSCYADPRMIKNKKLAAEALASALQLNNAQVLKKLKETKGSFVWLKRNVPFNQMSSLKDRKISGISFKTEYRRHYPQGPLAPHLLGMVGLDGHGLSGLEQAFEKSLNNFNNGTVMSDYPVGQVQLTLDARIQTIAERELKWGVDKTKAKRGMVVIQDPVNGEVLAMAAWPPVSTDPDRPSKPEEMRIPALVDVFEPGSTFKAITAAAAIEERLTKPKELFDGEKGAWKVSGITIHDHEPRKIMSFDEIWMYSSNIGTAKIGERIGSERLYQYARLFGFGVFPGCGLSCEAKGVLRIPSQWSGVSKFVVSFGQEVGVTALQMTGAYSAIANGGKLMEPRMIKTILSDKNDVLWKETISEVRRVISQPTAAELTRILERTVETGTGTMAQIKWSGDIKVAGKTGTAQKFDVKDGRYHPELTLVSFCGFFPSQAPRYTMLVILDEPEGRRWGGLDAAPVFRRIGEQLVPLMNDEKAVAKTKADGPLLARFF